METIYKFNAIQGRHCMKEIIVRHHKEILYGLNAVQGNTSSQQLLLCSFLTVHRKIQNVIIITSLVAVTVFFSLFHFQFKTNN